MEVGGEGVVCDATCDATWTGWLPRGHVGSRHIGHVTSLPSLEAKQALAIPTYCFLVLHLAKNSEHFQDNIDNCLSRWMRVLFFWLLTAIKFITSVSFSVNHPADVDRQLRRAHSETASILWTDVGAGTPDALF